MWLIWCGCAYLFGFGSSQADFPTVIGVTLDREDGSTPMETDGDKGKQSGTTYYIDTNQLRVPRESMEVMSPLKNGMSECRLQVFLHGRWPIWWLLEFRGLRGYFQTRVTDVNRSRTTPRDHRLPQRDDLEHYCLVLKLSSVKAPLCSIFSAIWASDGGAEDKNAVHVIMTMWEGCRLLSVPCMFL